MPRRSRCIRTNRVGWQRNRSQANEGVMKPSMRFSGMATAALMMAGLTVTADVAGGGFVASATASAAVTTASPVSIMAGTTPTIPMDSDTASVELGVKFVPLVGGHVTGIRFYKGGSANSGIHRGRLWTSSGVKLADVAFTSESTSGWQTATLTSPVSITVGQSYVASYLAPTGRYSVTESVFTAERSSAFFRTPVNAGVYKYGSGGGFPTQSYKASNYFVDVRVTPSPTVSASPTPSPTVSASPTPSPTVSASPTPSPTVSASPTPSPVSAPVTATPTLVRGLHRALGIVPVLPQWKVADRGGLDGHRRQSPPEGQRQPHPIDSVTDQPGQQPAWSRDPDCRRRVSSRLLRRPDEDDHGPGCVPVLLLEVGELRRA